VGSEIGGPGYAGIVSSFFSQWIAKNNVAHLGTIGFSMIQGTSF
jgi:hypothetical protein